MMNEFLFPQISRRDIDFATVSCSQNVITAATAQQSPEHFKVCVETA